MQLGQTREVIEVTGEGSAVNTEDSKLGATVSGAQIANLPLNGRNVYDLIQMAPARSMLPALTSRMVTARW